MKKLITILTIAALALTSTFAVTTSFDGSSDKAPEMNVTLKSSLEQTNYDLSLLYGKIDFTNDAQLTIGGLDLTEKGITDEFNVMISNGNLNKTITFVTEITEKPFVGLVDGEEYTTKNNLKVVDVDGNNKTSYSSKIVAGPQESQSVATFFFNWDADKALPAGDYATTNTISISVN
jgi:hypothetical protein